MSGLDDARHWCLYEIKCYVNLLVCYSQCGKSGALPTMPFACDCSSWARSTGKRRADVDFATAVKQLNRTDKINQVKAHLFFAHAISKLFKIFLMIIS